MLQTIWPQCHRWVSQIGPLWPSPLSTGFVWWRHCGLALHPRLWIGSSTDKETRPYITVRAQSCWASQTAVAQIRATPKGRFLSRSAVAKYSTERNKAPIPRGSLDLFIAVFSNYPQRHRDMAIALLVRFKIKLGRRRNSCHILNIVFFFLFYCCAFHIVILKEPVHLPKVCIF